MFEISNETLTVQISAAGAELQSIINKNNSLEYMWSGDPAFWGKKSPVLFPIVGGLKNGSYQHQGITYQLGRHGFAREREFTVHSHSTESIRFSLVSDETTKEVYPFDFVFSIEYSLSDNKLTVKYIVENIGRENLLFSVGAHPAFKVPLVDGTNYEDYHLIFSDKETVGIYPLSPDGLIEKNTEPLLNNSNSIPLTKALFAKDALVFKELRSDYIGILNHKNTHGLKLHYSEFPFMGIWAAKNADFVCIEPWCGIADSVDTTGELAAKEGINKLAPKDIFERAWTVEVF
ncbi:MAG: aldose 1-epimerase family protein [Bacteroidetes bacterium]|nr:aldose 1-epimerase family protein [Bacteroidota bacterium]